MTPIGVVVAGLLVELLDLRLGGFDVLPDPVGWVVAASGLCRLGAYGDWFGTAALAAVVTALFALPDMIHPTRVIESDVGGAVSTTTKAGPPVGLQGVLVAAYGVATVVAVVLIAVAVASAARDAHEGAEAQRFRVLAVALAALPGVAAAAAFALVDGAPSGGVAALVLILVLAGLPVHAWFLLALYHRRGAPWLEGSSEGIGATR